MASINPAPTRGHHRPNHARRPDDRGRHCGLTEATDLSSHLPLILVGLAWLFDTEQPTLAIADPCGQQLRVTTHRVLSFIPDAGTGRGRIRIDATDPHSGVERPAVPAAPVTAQELAGVVDLMDGMDEDVVQASLAADGRTAQLLLARRLHPSLINAVARYSAGRHPHDPATQCTCDWGINGRRQLIGVDQLLERARARSIPALATTALVQRRRAIPGPLSRRGPHESTRHTSMVSTHSRTAP